MGVRPPRLNRSVRQLGTNVSESKVPIKRWGRRCAWILTASVFATFAQASADPPRSWLEPCTALETASIMELELYKRRTSVLRLDTFAIPETRFPIARLLVEPSFEPDWVVSVYHP